MPALVGLTVNVTLPAFATVSLPRAIMTWKASAQVGTGFWTDAGTHESLRTANELVLGQDHKDGKDRP